MIISSGRLAAIERILSLLRFEDKLTLDELTSIVLLQNPSISREIFLEAYSACLDMQLVSTASGAVKLTPSGQAIIETPNPDLVVVQRRILAAVITKIRRDLLWVAFVRPSELIALAKNEHECFEQLGLIDYKLSETASTWWERLRKAGSLFNDQVLKALGDEAELLSLDYEKIRLADSISNEDEIRWVSRESDLLGFDILSFVGKSQPPTRLNIEVKKLTRSSDQGFHFFISRNEARTAEASPNYVFHLWDFQTNGDRLLHIAPKDFVLARLPIDNAYLGLWESARVNISSAEADSYRAVR